MKIKETLSRVIAFLLNLVRPSVSKIVGEFDTLLIKLDKLIALHERKIERGEVDLKASKQRAIAFAEKEEVKRGRIYEDQRSRQAEVDRANRIRENVNRLIG